MIIFYSDSGVELNLTNLKITFVQENSFFFNAFFKNRSLPFSFPFDDEISIKLGLIDEENISNYNVKYSGNLFIDNKFQKSYFLIEVIEGTAEATLYYGDYNLPLMETKLSALPFPVNNSTSLISLAKSMITKNYPEVSHNFPMVFDDEFHKESNYEEFLGLLNNYDGSNFLTNYLENRVSSISLAIKDISNFDASTGAFPGSVSVLRGYAYTISVGGTISGVVFEVGDFIIALKDNPSTTIYDANWYKYTASDIENVVVNKNIMVPFLYVMEILKVGFESAGLEMIGTFTENKANNNILLDPKKHLEKFSTSTFETYQLSTTSDEYFVGETLIYEYTHTHTITSIGSYNLKVFLNLPTSIKIKELLIITTTETLLSGISNNIDETVTVNKESATPSEAIIVKLTIEATTVDISKYNNFEFEKGEGKLNIFSNNYSLAEFMPDMTFGAYLAKIKDWLNLEVKLRNTYAVIDYIEPKFFEVTFKDESKTGSNLEIIEPKRAFNQYKAYKLMYDDTNYILVDKNGRIYSTDSFREEDIVKIEMGINIMPVEQRNAIFTGIRQKDADFSLLIYKGLDANGYPVVTDNVDGITFKLQEIYTNYWKKWLLFRLNSETYTDKFKAHSLEEFDIHQGRFKYNKKHLYKTIKHTRVSEEEWEIEVESETFFSTTVTNDTAAKSVPIVSPLEQFKLMAADLGITIHSTACLDAFYAEII